MKKNIICTFFFAVVLLVSCSNVPKNLVSSSNNPEELFYNRINKSREIEQFLIEYLVYFYYPTEYKAAREIIKNGNNQFYGSFFENTERTSKWIYLGFNGKFQLCYFDSAVPGANQYKCTNISEKAINAHYEENSWVDFAKKSTIVYNGKSSVLGRKCDNFTLNNYDLDYLSQYEFLFEGENLKNARLEVCLDEENGLELYSALTIETEILLSKKSMNKLVQSKIFLSFSSNVNNSQFNLPNPSLPVYECSIINTEKKCSTLSNCMWIDSACKSLETKTIDVNSNICTFRPGIICKDYKVENDEKSGKSTISLVILNEMFDIENLSIEISDCGKETYTSILQSAESSIFAIKCNGKLDKGILNKEIKIDFIISENGLSWSVQGNINLEIV